MDMSKAYISATEEHVPNAEMKICFDRFHVAQSFSKAVSKIRSMEDRALRGEGHDDLKGTRYARLSNEGPAIIRMSDDDFSRLRRIAQKTARAWALRHDGIAEPRRHCRNLAVPRATSQEFVRCVAADSSPIAAARSLDRSPDLTAFALLALDASARRHTQGTPVSLH